MHTVVKSALPGGGGGSLQISGKPRLTSMLEKSYEFTRTYKGMINLLSTSRKISAVLRCFTLLLNVSLYCEKSSIEEFHAHK
jgi:hypothetical protein